MMKLVLCPEEAGYAAAPGAEAVAAKLDGGASRFRADQLGAAALINVQWTLDALQYQYLMAFYRSATARGSTPFLIDLIMDSGSMQEYTAHFMPGTLALTGRTGTAYLVAAQLEALPQDEDAAYDTSLVDVFTTYGPESPEVLALLAELVNEDLPEALG